MKWFKSDKQFMIKLGFANYVYESKRLEDGTIKRRFAFGYKQHFTF